MKRRENADACRMSAAGLPAYGAVQLGTYGRGSLAYRLWRGRVSRSVAEDTAGDGDGGSRALLVEYAVQSAMT
ncbi:hypothetical protein GCM10009748_31350 [Agromyces lapidis]